MKRKQARRVNHPAGGTLRQQRDQRLARIRHAVEIAGVGLVIAAGAALLVAFAVIGPTLIP